ncbi:MAG TPA: hypothetical protein VJB98_03750 [Candidatus Paceibacterota bacterium]
MNTRYKIIGVVIVLAIVGVALLTRGGDSANVGDTENGSLDRVVYEVEGGTTTGVETFGEPVFGDLDGDGELSDAAVWLTYDGGGSGTFFYAAFALKDSGGYVASKALFLGDRIAPQNIEIQDGLAVYNYAVREEGEPMTAQPSVAKSTWVKLDFSTNKVVEVTESGEPENSPEPEPKPEAGVVMCKPEQRNQDACIALYKPVCGLVNVQCIKEPCPPLEQTFSNSCEACSNELVDSYTGGACE